MSGVGLGRRLGTRGRRGGRGPPPTEGAPRASRARWLSGPPRWQPLPPL
ncbi:hypothetical protein BU14_0166s0024 [Porphyra umbilicalis]|uniref:Uncharacterized protein n=1 Tax=Porphyra umbilicalis TaxID=2786 RepID=A0A1X6P800_PORUM|nr:hypothetical protein BU14_0166s0024 [Porphyra umbilicalis]|eukprot:OSX76984.1 hypothetical protein BU14_0166s0024 [Porphyra umbilicalis]